MKKILSIAILLLILSGCGPSPEQLSGLLSSTVVAMPTATAYPTQTPYLTQTPYPTYTTAPTYTPYPTLTLAPTQTPRIVVVTATSSPTPEFTPTATIPPTNTVPPTATLSPQKADKEAGFYLVGIDIQPGVWRSQGNGDDCYWAVTTKTGDIIDNHFGMAGGTMFVNPNGYQVELGDGCGTWIFLE